MTRQHVARSEFHPRRSVAIVALLACVGAWTFRLGVEPRHPAVLLQSGAFWRRQTIDHCPMRRLPLAIKRFDPTQMAASSFRRQRLFISQVYLWSSPVSSHS